MYVVLWLDDVREPNYNWNKYICGSSSSIRPIWCRSVNEAKAAYNLLNFLPDTDFIIDLDHDAGDYASEGGDYIKFLDWLEEEYPEDFPKIIWHIHSMNPVGIANMRQIIERNGAYLK
jgi:hypothetical protein